ncbi:unnamed protein product [Nezara viridula]|uniref:Uncharacterized protein n=1 Tax=Nezara viridula TaxID=85310 RepID=A0A9P0MSJ6_NEZVI|nr:unnamed protein product [Nezara viridula]
MTLNTSTRRRPRWTNSNQANQQLSKYHVNDNFLATPSLRSRQGTDLFHPWLKICTRQLTDGLYPRMVAEASEDCPLRKRQPVINHL